jgi:hypothetical protein
MEVTGTQGHRHTLALLLSFSDVFVSARTANPNNIKQIALITLVVQNTTLVLLMKMSRQVEGVSLRVFCFSKCFFNRVACMISKSCPRADC